MKKISLLFLFIFLSATALAASVEDGKKNIDKAVTEKKAVILLYGGMAKNPIISLIFTDIEAWERLPQGKKESVCLYMRNFVAKAKSDPEPYINIPTSAPVYPFIVSNAKNMCDDCWSIMSNDGYLVVGDEAWKSLEYKGKSQPFSTFSSRK